MSRRTTILLIAGALLAPWTQSPGAVKERRPVEWSQKLGLHSLRDIDAQLLKAFEDSFRLQPKNDSGAWVIVHNCNEYLALAKAPFKAESNRDYEAVRALGLRCFALQVIKNAQPSRETFLAEFRMDERAGDWLPPSLGFPVSPDQEDDVRTAQNQGTSWKKFDPGLKIHPVDKDEISAEGDGWFADVTYYARGDFDGDGIEDLLLRRDGGLRGGTYRSSALFILTRTGNGAPIHVVREID